MYLLGTILIISGIAAALLASASYVLVTRGNVAALAYGRIGTRAALGAVLLVVLLLTTLFLMQRYDVKYVYDYSSSELEFGFRVASMWAGQPGSFVVWALWGLIAAQFLVRRSRHAEPYVLSIFMFIQAALLLFMLIRNPFVPFTDPATGLPVTPADGKGLNELLHNPWMIIHPPILFFGYALLAVPFAFALAGLWRRDYDGWVRQALPWTLAGWSFLGLALLLGGYWAYETLGWGGYWGWDPVENSALVPWLTTTALLHAMLAQRTHGGLRRGAFALAVLTYILVFYATFLTRSGVLSSFSVHSFVEEGLKYVMTSALALCAIGGAAFLAWRWRDIPLRPLSEKLLSRDSFFVLMILGLLVIATVVGVGTSMPVISAIPGVGHTLQGFFSTAFEIDNGTTYGPQAFTDGRFGLVGSFYGATVPPLGLVLIALLIVGPLLGWRDTNPRRLLRALRWPAVAAVGVTCGALLLGARDALPLAYLGLGTFAAGANLLMIVRTLRSGWLRIGGYLAHVGMVVMLTGVVGSVGYAAPDQRIVIPQGDSISAYGYKFTFNGYRVTPQNKGLLDITVARGNEIFNATPLIYFNDRMGATIATPSIKGELLQDLYISPAEYTPQVDHNAAAFVTNDRREIGPYTITFLGFDASQAHEGEAEVGAKLKVLYQGQETLLTPKVKLTANATDPTKAFQDLPATLPGGHNISLANFEPVQRQAFVRVDGLNLPVDPAKAVVTISLKPAIKLVWLGVIIGVLGGQIALLRRALEGRALPGERRVRLPRRLGEVMRSVGGD
ncbi:MAG: cytochrome c biogenesis protein CcsA [Roseiflexaceae bacterium]